MQEPLFDPFVLVGGTSLSLQLGHRESIDIDLFTDVQYGTIDFTAIDIFLRENFTYVAPPPSDEMVGAGTGYFIGDNRVESVKLDLFYTDAYIRPALVQDGIRLAVVDEIAAMKMGVVQIKGRKKDFWDIHEMLDYLSIDRMIDLHAERCPHGHDEPLLRRNLLDFSLADEESDPVCLRGKYWELIKHELMAAMT